MFRNEYRLFITRPKRSASFSFAAFRKVIHEEAFEKNILWSVIHIPVHIKTREILIVIY
jgi:hypothetical protein